jgi:hypothetical protein
VALLSLLVFASFVAEKRFPLFSTMLSRLSWAKGWR